MTSYKKIPLKSLLKRRLAPYKGRWLVFMLESNFKYIFSPFWMAYNISSPLGYSAVKVAEAIDKLLKVATEEEIRDMIYRLDEYQISKRMEK